MKRQKKFRGVLFGSACALFPIATVSNAFASTGCDALLSVQPYYGSSGIAGDLNNDGSGGVNNSISDIPIWSSFKAGNVIQISTNGNPSDFTWSNIGTVSFSGTTASYTVTAADVARGATRFNVSWTGGNNFSYIDFSCSTGTETGSSSGNNIRKIQLAGTKATSRVAANSFAAGIEGNVASRLPLCPADSARVLWLYPERNRFREDQCIQDDRAVRQAPAKPGRIVKGTPAVAATSDDRRWSVWGNIQHSGFEGDEHSNLRQFTGMAGFDYLLNPNLLMGVMGGYEHSNFKAKSLSGFLDGNGGTAGVYMGYRLTPSVRADLAYTWTWLDYGITDNSAASPVTASLGANRQMLSGGITGNYMIYGMISEPSVRGLWIYQNEKAYVDSSGSVQDRRTFSAGRASFGSKLSVPYKLVNGVYVSPYLGGYGDYWFGHDTAALDSVSRILIADGWSARATGGLSLSLDPRSHSVSFGIEVGGLGSGVTNWSWKASGSLRF